MPFRIVVCGDSFSVSDDNFPGLHWIDKLQNQRPKYEIINLSQQGASNGLISLQVLQGIQLRPDFMVVNFSSTERYESNHPLKNLINPVPGESTPEYFTKLIQSNFFSTNSPGFTSQSELHEIYQKWITLVQSQEMNYLRNKLMLASCLHILKSNEIGFCYSPGSMNIGKENLYKLFNHLRAYDPLAQFLEYEIQPWFWNPEYPHGNAKFHIVDDQLQQQHCQNVLDHIDKFISTI